ncbi:MAG: tRNA (adenosine(37)-N6)-threonylcarbamoyltransferase complex ATPase subunit type 1 TsaE [Acidobacteria bacterium]|nr:tRNA (adenosine(37)-N6)-threonylcarbamoyltransferase complex ATPase subunit type 1 TsaE [Acidobacteriota bacterium]
MEFNSKTPERTFELGREIGAELAGGEMILLSGGLGAGKTLFTKGILDALGYDVDEVTSPSFTLVNLYRTDRFDVYHIDLWRIDGRADAAGAVGLHEILEDPKAVTIVEWSERLTDFVFPDRVIKVYIEGDGDDPRRIEIVRVTDK